MTSIEFGKKCRPYNIKYKNIFGYVPCRDNYKCNQNEYFDALVKAIQNKNELHTLIPLKNKDIIFDKNKKYQSYKQLTWSYVKPLLSEQSIDNFEKLTTFNFPETFKDCIRKYNGGRPNLCIFSNNKQKIHSIKTFLSFNPEDKENVWKIYQWQYDDIANHYIPIAIDNFGNIICFNYNSEIIFYNHENQEIEYVSSSFDEFIISLY